MKVRLLAMAAVGISLAASFPASATPECPVPELPNRYYLFEQNSATNDALPDRFDLTDGEHKLGEIIPGGSDSQKFFDYGQVFELHGAGENAPFYGAARVAKNVSFGSRIDVVDCNGKELAKIREEYSHEETEPKVGYKFCDPEWCGSINVAEKDDWFSGAVTIRDAISNKVLALLNRPARGWYPDHWTVTKEQEDGHAKLDPRVLALFGGYKIIKDYERHQASYREWEQAGKAIGKENVLGENAPTAPAEAQDLESMGLHHVPSVASTPYSSLPTPGDLEGPAESTATSGSSWDDVSPSSLNSAAPSTVVVHEGGWSYWQNYFYWEMLRQQSLRDRRRSYASAPNYYSRRFNESGITPRVNPQYATPPSRPWRTKEATKEAPVVKNTPRSSVPSGPAGAFSAATLAPKVNVAPRPVPRPVPQPVIVTPPVVNNYAARRPAPAPVPTPAPAPKKKSWFSWRSPKATAKPVVPQAVTPVAPKSATPPVTITPKSESFSRSWFQKKPTPATSQPAMPQARRERPAPIVPKPEVRRERPAPIAPKSAPRRERPAPIAPKTEPRRERPSYSPPKVEAPRYSAPKVERPRYTAPKVERPRASAPRIERPRSSSPSYGRSNSSRGTSSNRGSSGSSRGSSSSRRR